MIYQEFLNAINEVSSAIDSVINHPIQSSPMPCSTSLFVEASWDNVTISDRLTVNLNPHYYKDEVENIKNIILSHPTLRLSRISTYIGNDIVTQFFSVQDKQKFLLRKTLLAI